MCSCIKQHPLFNIPKCKSNKKHTCVVCLDSKKIFLECKHCYSCKICKDCVLPLSKSNLDKQCPLCRTEIDISKLIIIDNNHNAYNNKYYYYHYDENNYDNQ